VRGVIAMMLFVNVLEFVVSDDPLIWMSLLLLFYELVSVCADCSCCCGYHLIICFYFSISQETCRVCFLAEEWEKPYPTVRDFMNARLGIFLVRATNRCIPDSLQAES